MVGDRGGQGAEPCPVRAVQTEFDTGARGRDEDGLEVGRKRTDQRAGAEVGWETGRSVPGGELVGIDVFDAGRLGIDRRVGWTRVVPMTEGS